MSAERRDVVVVGGGAAGFFGAITCAEALQGQGSVTVLERGPQFLQKVKISGGGRCNVTHSCFVPKELAKRYPRGGQALIGAFHRFQAADTVKWFAARGVELKTEADGRMFPTTDQSQTIINCLIESVRKAGVQVGVNCGVERVERREGGGFRINLAAGASGLAPSFRPSPPMGAREENQRLRTSSPAQIDCDALLLATGGAKARDLLAASLGHTIEPPVPSLFTFHIADARLEGLSGLAVECATVSAVGTKLKETGPVLITHWGLSGPGILRLSAWGARELAACEYKFPLRVNWLPEQNFDSVIALAQAQRGLTGAKRVLNVPLGGLPSRLWERLVRTAGVAEQTQWAGLNKAQTHVLARLLVESEFAVTGKSMNKDEFVTCGGVRLGEVDFKTMQSRVCPGLYFAGELLDIDGITGGFNFQAAWTTGWLAGTAMAAQLARQS
jgi:predicted flavoprotein YhiN